jgi:hypothetical protein
VPSPLNTSPWYRGLVRWLRWIAVLLAIGAAVNVAVAWLVAIRVPVNLDHPHYASYVLPSGERGPYLLWRQGAVELIKWHWYMIRSPEDAQQFPVERPPWWSDVAARQSYNPPGAPFFVNVRVEVASGWPMRSMRWCYAVKDPPGSLHFEPLWCAVKLSDHTGVQTGSVAKARAIPLSPAWQGFLVNSLAFAVMLSPVPILVRWAIRSRLRRRRCCPTCGYPAGQSAVCTECGRALPK